MSYQVGQNKHSLGADFDVLLKIIVRFHVCRRSVYYCNQCLYDMNLEAFLVINLIIKNKSFQNYEIFVQITLENLDQIKVLYSIKSD